MGSSEGLEEETKEALKEVAATSDQLLSHYSNNAKAQGTYNQKGKNLTKLVDIKLRTLKCPACFWMNRAKGIKFPGMPGFLLNIATDTLLKKDFDVYREKQWFSSCNG